MAHNLIEQDDLLAAREVIAGRVHRTPVIGSSYLGGQGRLTNTEKAQCRYDMP